MRQLLSESKSSTVGTHLAAQNKGPAWLLAGALVGSAVLAAAAFVDQLSARSLTDHTDALYAAHGDVPGAGLVYGLLYTFAAVGVLLWAGVLRAALAGSRWAALMAAGSTLVMAALAAALLGASEYGDQVFPPVWGVLALVSSLAGAYATVLLVRGRRS